MKIAIDKKLQEEGQRSVLLLCSLEDKYQYVGNRRWNGILSQCVGQIGIMHHW